MLRDAALFDIGGFEYAGSQSDPLASLIFTGYNHGTRYTIVNGVVAVDNGELTGFDEKRLAVRANEIAFGLLDR